MFCAIYRFEVKPGAESEFEAAWRALTELIYQFNGSLGSRLHKDLDGVYFAYAQWPARTVWETADNLPAEADAHRDAMRAACSRIETIHELEVLDDLLRDQMSPDC